MIKKKEYRRIYFYTDDEMKIILGGLEALIDAWEGNYRIDSGRSKGEMSLEIKKFKLLKEKIEKYGDAAQVAKCS